MAGEHDVIADTQACHDDPFMHGCAFSAQWSADEEGASGEKEVEAMQLALGSPSWHESIRFTEIRPGWYGTEMDS